MKNCDIKILIVEDDMLMIKVLKMILEKEGYQISIANDGFSAIEKMSLLIPDLIITDIILPFCTGLEIISFAKEKFKNIPIIVVSALGQEETTVANAFNLGIDDFVSKPFSPHELLLRVKRLLNNRKLA
jgi:two-component system response regulator VicR